MAITGFGNNNQGKNDKVTKSDQIENYKHVVKLFGVPVITITKKHTIDSNVVEDL